MITNLLTAEATQTTFDLFESQPLLIIFDNILTQKVGPSYPRTVQCLSLGERNNFIDLQKHLLEFKPKISRNNDGVLKTGIDTANTDASH